MMAAPLCASDTMPDGVIDFYRLLIEQDPDSAPLQAHLAQALLDQGELGEAIAAASNAIVIGFNVKTENTGTLYWSRGG